MSVPMLVVKQYGLSYTQILHRLLGIESETSYKIRCGLSENMILILMSQEKEYRYSMFPSTQKTEIEETVLVGQ